MKSYVCEVLKQYSANHNATWLQKLKVGLANLGYTVGDVGEFVSDKGSVRIIENKLSYSIYATAEDPEILEPVIALIANIYNPEMSGPAFDTGRAVKEVVTVAAIAAGTVAAGAAMNYGAKVIEKGQHLKDVKDVFSTVPPESLDYELEKEILEEARRSFKYALQTPPQVNPDVIKTGNVVLGGSVILAAITNIKHKRPLLETPQGVRVAIRYPTTYAPEQVADFISSFPTDFKNYTVSKAEEPIGAMCVTHRFQPLQSIYFDAQVTRDALEVFLWQQSGKGQKRVEKDLPGGVVPIRKVGIQILKQIVSVLGVAPQFTEVDASLHYISTDPDAVEVPDVEKAV